MNQKSLLLLLLVIFSTSLFGQVGGDNVYEFLNLPGSARITGLGGSLVSVADDDLILGLHNPATLNQSMHQQMAFSHNIHLAGINNGFATYGQYVKPWETTFQAGMQYISYGNFKAADEAGNITGEFSSAEYAFVLGASKQLYEKLRLGANLKLITSQLESYNSLGIATDLGAFYQDTSGRFSAGLVFKNIGTQLTTYRPDNREALPFDIQLGISRRLNYLPFRFGLTAHNLQRWNILYDDPNAEEASFTVGDNQANGDNKVGMWVDNFFRHLIFNGEFLLGKQENLRIRFGYNHFRRKELTVQSAPRSLAGFSMGLGFKVNRFRIEYGHSFYHLAGGANQFSIATSLKEFRR